MIYSIEILIANTICIQGAWETFKSFLLRVVEGGEGGAVDVKFWTFTGGGGVTEIEQVQTRGKESPHFGHFMILT